MRLGCFLPNLGFTWQFFIKSTFCFEANLQQDELQYFWQNKGCKNATVAGSCVVWGVKRTWLPSPFFWGKGGGTPSPKRANNCPNHCFLQCFLVLHKSLTVASTPHLKRPSCELFWGPGSSNDAYYLHVYRAFLLARRKACIFTWFWGHERATRDPKRNKKQHFTCIITGFLHLG